MVYEMKFDKSRQLTLQQYQVKIYLSVYYTPDEVPGIEVSRTMMTYRWIFFSLK
jgi:hypothetical protein